MDPAQYKNIFWLSLLYAGIKAFLLVAASRVIIFNQ